MMNEHGKSDRPVVPVKSSNNAAGAPAAAEEMEGRGLAKEKDGRQNRPQTQCCARPVTSVGYPTVWAKAQARHHPRQEPGAVVPLAGIRAGGGGQPPSLPRPRRVHLLPFAFYLLPSPPPLTPPSHHESEYPSPQTHLAPVDA